MVLDKIIVCNYDSFTDQNKQLNRTGSNNSSDYLQWVAELKLYDNDNLLSNDRQLLTDHFDSFYRHFVCCSSISKSRSIHFSKVNPQNVLYSSTRKIFRQLIFGRRVPINQYFQTNYKRVCEKNCRFVMLFDSDNSHRVIYSM